MSKRPIIGISLDFEESGSFSSRPHYVLRQAYFDMIEKAGGLPVAIPYNANIITDYLNHIDGLCVPGGDYAFPSIWYVSGDSGSPFEETKRSAFDIALVAQALEINKPLLGICAGMQIMAGVKNCRLTAEITNHYTTEIDHLNEKPAEELAHSILIEKETLLHRIIGQDQMMVNTAHKEAVLDIAEGVVVSGKEPDGVIEAIEIGNHPFALGVQWHPEFFLDDKSDHLAIACAFVKAAEGQ